LFAFLLLYDLFENVLNCDARPQKDHSTAVHRLQQ
jgi:hypothetical protein